MEMNDYDELIDVIQAESDLIYEVSKNMGNFEDRRDNVSERIGMKRAIETIKLYKLKHEAKNGN